MALLTSSVGAQPSASAGMQLYDVELVIFRTLSSGATPEEWSLEAAAAGQRLAIPDDEPPAADEPTTPTAEPAPAVPVETVAAFPPVPAERLKLNAIEDTLKRSRNYQPLAHLSWTQPGFPRIAAKAISINSLVPTTSGLVGEIALSRGRYLHLTLDLVYTEPGAGGGPPQRFALRQTRRMRSNERHYIDHPRIGVVAVITPSTEVVTR